MATVGEVEVVAKPEPAATSKETTKDYYAWSPLRHGAEIGEEGHILKVHSFNYGDKVTQKELGVDDEEWNRLIALKVIRKSVPPKVGLYESPKRRLVKDAAKQMEIALAGGE